MNHRRRIVVAVGLLVVGGLVTRWLFDIEDAWDDSLYIASLYTGLLIAQVILLGLWGGLTTQSWFVRGVAILLSLAFLWAVLIGEVWGEILLDEAAGVAIAFVIPASAVLFSACWMQRRTARLGHFTPENLPHYGDPLRFGIRHIFIATTVAAPLMMGAMAMKNFYEDNDTDDFIWISAVFGMMLAVLYPLMALLSAWATLGLNRPWPRIPAVLGTVLMAAFAPWLFVPFDDGGGFLYSTSCLLQSLVVLAVLLVVRSAGYRLVPLTLTRSVSEATPSADRPEGQNI